MMRRYSRLRSSSSAMRRERDTYLFQDAEDSAAETVAGSCEACVKTQMDTKFMQKSDTESPRKHFMASIWKFSSLRERQPHSRSFAGKKSTPVRDLSNAGEVSELADLQKSNIRRTSSLTDSVPFSVVHSDPSLDQTKPTGGDLQSSLSLLRSTSARDSSLEVSVKAIGSLETAVHRALSVREGRLKPTDGLKTPSVKEKQSRIVVSSTIPAVNGLLGKDFSPKEQIKELPFEQNSAPEARLEKRSSVRRQESLGADHYEEAELTQGSVQKPMQKTQSMRYSQILTDSEDAWVPARNSSYFRPIALPKGSIFGGFDGGNLFHTYSQMDGECVYVECRICGCELSTVADGMGSVEQYTEVCRSCQSLKVAEDHPSDSPKTPKKKGGLIKACRRIFRLNKKNLFS